MSTLSGDERTAGAETDATATPRTRRRRRVRYVVFTSGILLVLAVATGLWYLRNVQIAYRDARASVDDVRVMIPQEGSGRRIQFSELPELTRRMELAHADLRTLQDRVDVPLLTPIARRLPVLGPQVRSSEDFVALGVDLAGIAADSSRLASDIYDAYQITGLSGEADPDQPTWLNVVQANRAQIDQLLARFDAALADRAALDEDNLPERGKRFLASVDPLLDRAEQVRQDYGHFLDYYPLVNTAVGDEQDGRYLVLLLNSQEIRPAGGFPGTYAIITVREGRLIDYQIDSILTLDALYAEHRTEVLPAPPPIQEHLLQMEWLPRDITWLADFPQLATTLLEMYDITGEPPIQGVIAVDDRAVREVIDAIGEFQVDIDGQPVTITATNVIDVIESYRAAGDEKHKGVVRTIGAALLDRIKSGGTDVQKRVLTQVSDLATTREIQLYAVDPDLQAEVESRGWDGSLEPRPGVPTLGMTVANIVGNKASNRIVGSAELDLTGDASGMTGGRWTITLSHTGDPEGDQVYNGFHRTWLALYLPTGARLTDSTLDPAPPEMNDDPRAIGYHIELLPGEEVTLTVEFELATPTEQLILRRQPGFNDIDYSVERDAGPGAGQCALDERFDFSRDMAIDLATCTVTPVRP